MGFNIWVDPIGIDRVYYVSSIAFQGSADGVYTNFGLTMGRTLSDFVSGKASIASMNPGSSPNIFINQLAAGYKVSDGNFGEIVGKTADAYTSFKTTALKFHMGIDTSEGSLINASASKYYQTLYGKLPPAPEKNSLNEDSTTKYSAAKNVDPGSWSSTLERGSSGADVRELQTLLKSLGYDIGTSGVDGKFGKDTMNAVIAFQKANGLTADGKVGPNTRRKLEQKKTKSESILSDCRVILMINSKGKYVTALQE
jgi:hypothetical protein